ncbi:hypothetical protein DFP73DRAFT_594712 [Morchella snyderi]|nr:hypothetical protein DFP73DRAFT_594712 [Morchella snyderi]
MSSSSLTSNESTGIDPSTVRDSLEVLMISPARRPIRRHAALSPAGEDMPISGINTPQRSTLARNNPYKNWFPGFEDSTDAAPPNNPTTSSTGVTTTNTSTGVTTTNTSTGVTTTNTSTGVTTTNTSTGVTTSTSDSVTTIITGGDTANANIPILGPFGALKKSMKDLIQLPIDAVKLRIHNLKMKRDANLAQKARIVENKRKCEVDALLINRIAQGLGGVDATTQSMNQIEQDDTLISTTATTTALLASSSQYQASTVADNNTNGMGDLSADTRNNVKASEHKKVTFADKKDADDNNKSKRHRFA